MLPSRRSRRTAAGLTLVASAVLLLAAACGGGGSGGDNDSAGATNSTSGAGGALAAYADCMSKNGVKLDIPTAFPSGRPFAQRSGRPTNRPTAFPTVRPSGFPTSRPSGGFGGRGGLGRPAGVDDATWQKAMTACRSALPSFAPGEQGGPGGGARNGAFTAYRNCLNDHGVTATGVQGLSTADPKIAAALKACAVLRPTAFPTAAPSPAG